MAGKDATKMDWIAENKTVVDFVKWIELMGYDNWRDEEYQRLNPPKHG